MARARSDLSVLTAIWIAGLLLSGWHPFDRTTWAMEVAPAVIALPVLWATARRFPLTRLALVLIAVHGLILMLGGAYTYERVPLGYVLEQSLGLARNPYDRIGHFAQGFVPAVVFREILIRLGRLPRGVLLTGLTLACCLAVSALYELIEFGAAMGMGQGADAFLGMQGDPWDTQWDMLTCLIGAAVSVVLLGGLHERALARQRGVAID
ncbi:DUF2238 domain-containing protein [Novosphingobium sp. 9]|uniref:DUF2238 domain-containing protein n=1 Tax=Novosphingobium sp. 9 TaxID=2025349 RepID=UPI0021B61313|nr:DUF2238 domain-containing protein [Novosphingobium sp. 9]